MIEFQTLAIGKEELVTNFGMTTNVSVITLF